MEVHLTIQKDIAWAVADQGVIMGLGEVNETALLAKAKASSNW